VERLSSRRGKLTGGIIDTGEPVLRLPIILRSAVVVILVAAVCGSLTGCRPAPQAASVAANGEQSFPVRGKIESVDSAKGSVVLNHGDVPGYMSGMAMPYGLKDPNIIGELHPGDEITAKILVHKDADGFRDPKLDEIVIVGQSKPDYVPAVQYHLPKPGDLVPDLRFTNQSGRTIHIDQFRGKVLLLTFIYTRCQLADFCPKMSRNFAAIDQQLAKYPKLYAKTHLLSISFDPKYDTPQVLRSYGGGYTGRYTNETFAHWDFAAPSVQDLPKTAEWFAVGITPGAPGTLNHSLSTAIIDPTGHIAAWYPTGDWTPDQALAVVKRLAE
jgi:protein SCO1/2